MRWSLVWLSAVAVLAVFGSPLYYNYWDKERHRELRSIARWINTHPGGLVVYQMGRRSADLGTGSAELQETSHPSLSFYLHSPFHFAESLSELGALRPTYVLTRKDRLSRSDLEELRAHGLEFEPTSEFSGFEGYVLFEAIHR